MEVPQEIVGAGGLAFPNIRDSVHTADDAMLDSCASLNVHRVLSAQDPHDGNPRH